MELPNTSRVASLCNHTCVAFRRHVAGLACGDQDGCVLSQPGEPQACPKRGGTVSGMSFMGAGAKSAISGLSMSAACQSTHPGSGHNWLPQLEHVPVFSCIPLCRCQSIGHPNVIVSGGKRCTVWFGALTRRNNAHVICCSYWGLGIGLSLE